MGAVAESGSAASAAYTRRSYDLIVIGAGIVGAACAEAAAGEGLRVAIVEPGPIGGGATAAAMGHLVAMDDDPAELALSAYSLRLWERFATLSDAEFSRCGTLWVARDARELAA
ncbi:D-amino-acid oxidase, partial [Xanthomonas perforans]